MEKWKHAWRSPWLVAGLSCLIGILIVLMDALVEQPSEVVRCYQEHQPEKGGWLLKGTVRFERTRYLSLFIFQLRPITRTAGFDFFFPDPENLLVYKGAYQQEATARARDNLGPWSINPFALLGTVLVYAALCWVVWAIINTRRTRSKAELVAPFFLPLLFAAVHAYFDRTYFLKRFGCGCDHIDQAGQVMHTFNNNDFNTILFSLVFTLASLCAVVWSRGQPRADRVTYLIFAVLFIGVSCFVLCPRYM
jgi:hypothetical protein